MFILQPNKEKNYDSDFPTEKDTLDEPIKVTLMRDLIKIKHKLVHVIVPRMTADKSQQLRNCNLTLIIRGFMGAFSILHVFSYVNIN